MSAIIASKCPKCNKGMYLKSDFSGQELECPNCRESIIPLKIASSMQICSTCNTPVAKSAKTCPSCGQKLKSDFSILRVALLTLWTITALPLLFITLSVFGFVIWIVGFIIILAAK